MSVGVASVDGNVTTREGSGAPLSNSQQLQRFRYEEDLVVAACVVLHKARIRLTKGRGPDRRSVVSNGLRLAASHGREASS